MKKSLITTCLLFTLFTIACKNKDKTSSQDIITVVSQEEMQTLLMLDDVQFIDVRTPEEHSEGYIIGSQNIDFTASSFDKDILRLDKNKPVVLYCRSGGRSAKCAKKMKDAGFTKIYDLEGGFSKWKQDGLEFTTEL